MQHVRYGLLMLLVLLASCGSNSTPTPQVQATPSISAIVTVTIPPQPEATPSQSTSAGTMSLSSTAFKDGEAIPLKYAYIKSGTCAGENYSPPLTWTDPPAGTQSFALVVLDSSANNWVHWIQFNIPADQRELSEAVDGPDAGIKGRNSYGNNTYGGPCPPSGNHTYVFTLYALDSMLELKEGAFRSDVENAMKGHILQQTVLSGTYSLK